MRKLFEVLLYLDVLCALLFSALGVASWFYSYDTGVKVGAICSLISVVCVFESCVYLDKEVE